MEVYEWDIVIGDNPKRVAVSRSNPGHNWYITIDHSLEGMITFYQGVPRVWLNNGSLLTGDDIFLLL